MEKGVSNRRELEINYSVNFSIERKGKMGKLETYDVRGKL